MSDEEQMKEAEHRVRNEEPGVVDWLSNVPGCPAP